ncbi:hypothetical protein BAE36_25075 [Rhizobium leguminosarum bv. trifolii]|uniref:Uncharacterized protein n=1 Tax=Rhizobium leguminosarum bv. trifolii TaxID=386 RepID=A0A1B8R6P2_RHILT|nr:MULTISPECIES: hypothetical protein [Rhizobium]AOO92660.1 hypothetical protein [Rhizobium leguminosarum bv. trifolii]OBY04485.1 hypothetical protein BAE36_25075 [Rhizobium leguminosarum bv. trifolii]WSG87373.1 hypothetical protein U8P73_15075 [Rhizobium beringeri]
MNILTYPLSYLMLTDESNKMLYRRNLVALAILSLAVSAPFIIADANFFGDKGFLDRIGSFSAVLTGFYIAALVGIASFSTSIGDLDEEIEVGPIFRQSSEGVRESLTRRQYVCALFGYLSFVSLIISLGSILLIVVGSAKTDLLSALSAYPEVRATVETSSRWIRDFAVLAISLSISHMFVTTCHGLYYMIDRLYYKEAQLLDKSSQEKASTEPLAIE